MDHFTNSSLILWTKFSVALCKPFYLTFHRSRDSTIFLFLTLFYLPRHDVAEIAGVAAFSFGEEEVDRAVTLYKKEFAPCDEELAALRRGEEWDPLKAQAEAERVCILFYFLNYSTYDFAFLKCVKDIDFYASCLFFDRKKKSCKKRKRIVVRGNQM